MSVLKNDKYMCVCLIKQIFGHEYVVCYLDDLSWMKTEEDEVGTVLGAASHIVIDGVAHSFQKIVPVVLLLIYHFPKPLFHHSVC